MAKIKLGAVITDASGKIGGMSILSTKDGHVLKSNGVRTIKQNNSNNKLKSRTNYLMQYWSKLSRSQQELWKEQTLLYGYIDGFGDINYYSPFYLFQKLNQGWLNFNSNLLEVPSMVHKPKLISNLSAMASTSSLIFQSSGVEASTIYKIYATRQLSPGTSKPHKYFRQIAVVTGQQLINTVDLYSNYTQVFTNLETNDKLFIGAKSISPFSGYSNNKLYNFGRITVGSSVVNEFLFQDSNNYIFQDNNTYIFN